MRLVLLVVLLSVESVILSKRSSFRGTVRNISDKLLIISKLSIIKNKMGGKDISEAKKGAIIALLNEKNLSYREIATKVGVSASTVSRMNKKIVAGEDLLLTSRKNCKGVRKTSVRDDRTIVRAAVEERRSTNRELTRKLRGRDINISARTVRRRCREAGLFCRRPAKKPRLTPRMKLKRLLWARMHRSYTIADWNKVCEKELDQ